MRTNTSLKFAVFWKPLKWPFRCYKEGHETRSLSITKFWVQIPLPWKKQGVFEHYDVTRPEFYTRYRFLAVRRVRLLRAHLPSSHLSPGQLLHPGGHQLWKVTWGEVLRKALGWMTFYNLDKMNRSLYEAVLLWAITFMAKDQTRGKQFQLFH